MVYPWSPTSLWAGSFERHVEVDNPLALSICISGTDHGLGASLARLLAERGDLVWAGRFGSTTRTASAGLRWVDMDISDEKSVQEATAQIRSATEHLDILINNAGILGAIQSTINDKLDFAEMSRVYEVNALGSLRLSQALWPLLIAAPSPLIVNISSEAASIGGCWRSSWFAYTMSKAALNMQSALLHNALRPHGGRVLTLHPGHVRTFMRGEEDKSGHLSPDEAARLAIANIQTYLDQGERWPAEHPAFLGPEGETLPW